MQNKLQELTDKLYNEGLSKGKQEAEEMKISAKSEAAKIIEDAKDEAKKIIEDANKDAQEMKSKVENDLRMASNQTISSIKQEVEALLITKSISTPLKNTMSDKDFVKSILSKIIGAFNASSAEPMALDLILPNDMQGELSAAIEKEVKDSMGNGLTISFSKQISNGFKIGPKEGGYMISFSDGDFERLIAEYLRPATRKILFG